MRSSIKAVIALAVSVAGINQTLGQKAITIPLDGLDKQRPLNVKTEVETYKGLSSLRVVDAAPPDAADGIQLVVLDNTNFRDGTIEIELTGVPVENAKVQHHEGLLAWLFDSTTQLKMSLGHECFYLRPTNGRVDDQVRRNHATQYISSRISPGSSFARIFLGSTKAMRIWSRVSGQK